MPHNKNLYHKNTTHMHNMYIVKIIKEVMFHSRTGMSLETRCLQKLAQEGW